MKGGNESFRAGVALGAAEAERTAALLGAKFQMVESSEAAATLDDGVIHIGSKTFRVRSRHHRDGAVECITRFDDSAPSN